MHIFSLDVTLFHGNFRIAQPPVRLRYIFETITKLDGEVEKNVRERIRKRIGVNEERKDKCGNELRKEGKEAS